MPGVRPARPKATEAEAQQSLVDFDVTARSSQSPNGAKLNVSPAKAKGDPQFPARDWLAKNRNSCYTSFRSQDRTRICEALRAEEQSGMRVRHLEHNLRYDQIIFFGFAVTH
jgi:hypothetical protein